jgi:hypothetical protein
MLGVWQPVEKVIFGCHWLCQCLDVLENSALAKPVALFFTRLLAGGQSRRAGTTNNLAGKPCR